MLRHWKKYYFILFHAGDISSALATLQNVKSISDTPALLSLRVAQLLHEKKNDDAIHVLVEAVKKFVSWGFRLFIFIYYY